MFETWYDMRENNSFFDVVRFYPGVDLASL